MYYSASSRTTESFQQDSQSFQKDSLSFQQSYSKLPSTTIQRFEREYIAFRRTMQSLSRAPQIKQDSAQDIAGQRVYAELRVGPFSVENGMGHDSIASKQSFVGSNTALFATRARVLRLPSSSSS